MNYNNFPKPIIDYCSTPMCSRVKSINLIYTYASIVKHIYEVVLEEGNSLILSYENNKVQLLYVLNKKLTNLSIPYTIQESIATNKVAPKILHAYPCEDVSPPILWKVIFEDFTCVTYSVNGIIATPSNDSFEIPVAALPKKLKKAIKIHGGSKFDYLEIDNSKKKIVLDGSHIKLTLKVKKKTKHITYRITKIKLKSCV
jgi:hypothetical protein